MVFLRDFIKNPHLILSKFKLLRGGISKENMIYYLCHDIFKIKYGDVPEELGDRLGAALLYLSATNQKIDAGREENKQGFGVLAGKMDMMLENQDDAIEAIER